MLGRSLIRFFEACYLCADGFKLLHWHHLVFQFHQSQLLVCGTYMQTHHLQLLLRLLQDHRSLFRVSAVAARDDSSLAKAIAASRSSTIGCMWDCTSSMAFLN